jgi:hypothetical protein
MGAVDAEAAGHAEMHHQHLAVVEPRQEIFGAAVERFDSSPGKPLRKVLRQRKAQVPTPLLDAHETIADQNGRQSKANGLNFRELGHEDHSTATRNGLRCTATIA